MPSQKSKKISIVLISAALSFLGVALLTYSATTISTNINTGGDLTVSGNSTLTGAVWASSTLQTTNAVTFYNDLTVDTNTLYIDSTNNRVGVGTTTPSALFAVAGSSFFGADSASTFTYNVGTFNYALSSTSTIPSTINSWSIATTTASNQASILSIDGSTGNIGIGTTTTSGLTSNPKLQIYNGNGRPIFAFGSSNVRFQRNNSSNSLDLYNSTTTAEQTAGITFSLDTLKGGSGNTYGRIGGGIENPGTLTDSSTVRGFLVFATFLSGSHVEKMRLTSSGYLGIATTSPYTLLQLATTTKPQLVLSDPLAGTNLKHWYASSTAGSLTFGTLNDALSTLTERTRIDSLGRVGIGTTTPTTMFQVATSTSNATTTIEIGKAGQNKGSCLTLYDGLGTKYFCSVQGGNFTCSTTSCE